MTPWQAFLLLHCHVSCHVGAPKAEKKNLNISTILLFASLRLFFRCDDLPPLQRSAARFQHIVMILPPERDSAGPLRAAKNVQGSLLPLLQELQRLGPKYTRQDLWRFDYVHGSLPSTEIGELFKEGLRPIRLAGANGVHPR